MTYQETVSWLFNQLPMYQRQGKSAYKADLSNTILLASHLENPEDKFKSIHVGGTNGKGSCSHMIASILQEAGYKVGLYTSPHLKDYRERIKINGVEISEEFVVEFVKKHKEFLEVQQLSFFEMTVGLAFDYFAKEKVDVAIIEVGLGGRLDSTNIITPELSIITNIGFDHVQFLGNTLPKIAFEKAGIIKQNMPIVIGESHEETKPVFDSKAKDVDAPIYFAEDYDTIDYDSDLRGSYQKKNIQTVVTAIKIIDSKGFEVSDENLRIGLKNVVKNTGLLGRWQVLSESPKIICDTAHNKEGLRYTMEQLSQETYNKLHIVFGVVNDKSVKDILPLLPQDAMYYLAKPNIQRGMKVEKLAEYFKAFGYDFSSFDSVALAYNTAKTKASNNDVIYVGGSTFVVAEVI